MVSRRKRSDAVVYAELGNAIKLAGGTIPCLDSSLFTQTNLSAGDLRIARQVCNSCPVFADCRAAGQELSRIGRANTVMGGVSYGDKGMPVSDGPTKVVAHTPKRVTKTAAKDAA